MDIFTIAIIFVLFLGVILILEIDNASKLNKLYKLAKLRNSPIPDAKYFELKSSINLIRILLTASVFLLGFLGFGSYIELKSVIVEEIDHEISKYDTTIIQVFNNYEKHTRETDSMYGLFSKQFDTTAQLNIDRINLTADLMEAKFESIDERLEWIDKITNVLEKNNDNLLYLPYVYPITKIVVKERTNNIIRIYYSDLRTSDNNKLPKFVNTPMILFEGCFEEGFVITEKNNEYFELKVNNFVNNLTKGYMAW
jgi:hypothetical protein